MNIHSHRKARRSYTAAALFLTLLVASLAGCGTSKEDAEFAKILPETLGPEDGFTSTRFPRIVVLTWKRIPTAERYMVEVEIQNKLDGVWMPAPVYLNRQIVKNPRVQITFPGSQPGRWRVAGVNKNGAKTRLSEWSRFEFVDKP